MSTTAISPTAQSGKVINRDSLWLLLALSAIALLGLPSILYPFHPDQAMFAYIGDRWLHGGLPYRDAWDVKPPGIFALYAAAQAVFGRGMAAARWADLYMTVTAGLFIYLLARRSLRPPLAALAPVLFALVYFTAFEFQDSAQSESFGAAFIAAYVWMLFRAADSGRRRWLIGAGILLGFAALLKTTFVLFAFLLPAVVGGGGFRSLARRSLLLAAGIALPLAATAAYFAAHGALGYLGELLVSQKAYGSLPDSAGLAKALRSTARFFRERPAMLMLCVIAGIGAWRSFKNRGPESNLYLAWTGIAAAMIAIQWRCHSYHFLPLLPPLSLLAAQFVTPTTDDRRPTTDGNPKSKIQNPKSEFVGRPSFLVPLALLLILLTPLAMGMRRYGLAIQRLTGGIDEKQYWACFAAPGWYPFGTSAETAEYVRKHTSTTDNVLVFDYDPAVYFLSERIAPTRHLSNEPIVGAIFFPAKLRDRWRRELIRDVNANPPALLVVGTCPHCHGLSEEHTFAPKTVQMGNQSYKLESCITKDRIYRLAANNEIQSVSSATAAMRSRTRTTASGE